jgi:hypothetical protein
MFFELSRGTQKKSTKDVKIFFEGIIFYTFALPLAEVVKLVDTHVSEACGASHAGSSPAFGTQQS